MTFARKHILALSLATCLASFARAQSQEQTLTIDARARIQDTALLDGEFARWNYGASPFLEAGFTVGIYAEHNAVSLIRFDLSGVRAEKITRAHLLVYKPRSFSQLHPVSIAVHEVSQRNRDWKQGSGFAETPPGGSGSTWSHLAPSRPWAGETGASLIGVDHGVLALNTQPARDDAGHWMIFELPVVLVERWLARPETNAGLRLSLAPSGHAPRWGEHVFFYSGEHHTGHGPRLILNGAGLSQTRLSAKNANPHERLPEKDAAFRKWAKSSSRMAGFTRDLKLNENQTLLFYYFDTKIRDNFVNALHRAPITELLPRLNAAVAAREEAAVRAHLDTLREKLLVWESIREVLWYTAGPLAENLTTAQLATLYTRNMWGKMEAKSNAKVRARAVERGEDPDSVRGVWDPLTGDAFRERQQQIVQRVINNTKPGPGHIAEFEPALLEIARLENEWLTTFNRHLDDTRDFAEGKRGDTADGWKSFRLMNHHHEVFLYYQSIFDTPRWHLFNEKLPLYDWARWASEIGARYALSEKMMNKHQQTKNK